MNKSRRPFSRLFVVLLGLTTLAALTSCASLVPNPVEHSKDPKKFYRRDLVTIIDGVKYPGWGVLPFKESGEYVFEVQTKHDMDRFSYTNCHKQMVEEKVDGVNLFKKTAKYKFTFKRTTDIEKLDPCVLELTASADGNEHSWGFFDFQDRTYQLKAELQCDGFQAVWNGVSICQGKSGLHQQITFLEKVYVDDSNKLPTKDNKTFLFEMPRERNVFVFCSKSGACHRLTTLGYDETWLREKAQ